MLVYYAPNLNALLFVECVNNLKKRIINENWRMKESYLVNFWYIANSNENKYFNINVICTIKQINRYMYNAIINIMESALFAICYLNVPIYIPLKFLIYNITVCLLQLTFSYYLYK